MHFVVTLVVALLGFAVTPAAAAESVGGPRAFSFVALGDMPYAVPADYEKFDRLIAAINALEPAFSIHVGDTKAGSAPCTDEALAKVLDQFRSFAQPLVYAIGDNEWTDCYRASAGRYDPRERLAKVRQMFFQDPTRSLGRTTLAVESQARVMPGFETFVENARFVKNDVMVVTLHVVGSNNGFETVSPEAAAEYFPRNRANLAWLEASVAEARRIGAKALVLALQANLWDIRDSIGTIPPASGFRDTIVAIEKHAKEFGGPVLVVQGDFHTLEVTGFRDTRMRLVPNVQRLQVMGESEVQAVRVIVDPDMPGVFGFVPLIVPDNVAK